MRTRRDARRALTHWPLLVPMIAGSGAFVALYFETRYVAAFAAVVYLAMLAPFSNATDDPHDRAPGEPARVVPLVIAGLLLVPVAYLTGLRALQLTALSGENPYWTMAQAVDARGIAAGSSIAVIGDAQAAFWARLGRYRIVAEIPPPQSDVFWSCGEQERQTVLDVLASTGAVGVVAVDPPGWARTSGWAPATEHGPLIAMSFAPRAPTIASDVPPSFLDYRVVRPCSPRRLPDAGS